MTLAPEKRVLAGGDMRQNTPRKSPENRVESRSHNSVPRACDRRGTGQPRRNRG